MTSELAFIESLRALALGSAARNLDDDCAVLELGGESGHDTHPHLYPGSYAEYVQRTGHEAPGVHG